MGKVLSGPQSERYLGSGFEGEAATTHELPDEGCIGVLHGRTARHGQFFLHRSVHLPVSSTLRRVIQSTRNKRIFFWLNAICPENKKFPSSLVMVDAKMVLFRAVREGASGVLNLLQTRPARIKLQIEGGDW
jgi:hypothetical protein